MSKYVLGRNWYQSMYNQGKRVLAEKGKVLFWWKRIPPVCFAKNRAFLPINSINFNYQTNIRYLDVLHELLLWYLYL